MIGLLKENSIGSQKPQNELRRCLRFVLLTFLTLNSGCGTLANIEGKNLAFLSQPNVRKPQYYGGIRNDFRWMKPQADESSDGRNHLVNSIAATAIWLPDLPLSAAADTISLPVVYYLRREYDQPPDRGGKFCVYAFHHCPKCNSLQGGIYEKGPFNSFPADNKAECVHDWHVIPKEKFAHLATEIYGVNWTIVNGDFWVDCATPSLEE